MGANFNFFTPVNYSTYDTGFSACAKQVADDYFSYKSYSQRAYVINVNDKNYKVQLVDCRNNPLATALKIASLATVAIPLTMLLIKIASRSGKTFTVVTPQPSQCKVPCDVVIPEKKQNNFDHAVHEKRYSDLFAKVGLEYSTATALQKHVAFFLNENSGITRASIQDGFERLKLGKITSIASSILIFRGVSSSTGTENGAIQLKDLAKGKHDSDTGVFTTTGELDLNKFQSLRQFAKTSPELLTQEEFAQMRTANRKRDQDKPGALSGAVGSKGEFDFALKLFSDRFVINKYGTPIPAITFDRLLKVYTDGPLLFEEVATQG